MRPVALFILVFLISAGSAARQPVSAQAAAAATIPEWETLRPEGEEFTILMPKNATRETGTHSYVKRELNNRLYLSKNPGGQTFAVVSFSGIKSNPALYTEMARLNSYVDAFRKWFPRQVTGKDIVARMSLVGEKTLNGHTGREYRVTIADMSGTAHVYATKKRFYAIVTLNTKEDDPLHERFLSSFFLPERVVEPPAPPPTVAEAKPKKEKPEKEGEASEKSDDTDETEESKKAKTAGADSGETPASKEGVAGGNPKQPGKKRPISGGVLNGRALYLPVPDYPPDARAAKAGGNVVVQITVDEYGNVTEAKAASGHPMLQQAAVNAALQARFQPTFLMGEPVKVTGVVTFNFIP